MKMTIHHVRAKRDFTIIHNSLIMDTRLSADARLTLIYLLSRPEGWQTWRTDLKNKMSIGDFKYRRIMKELADSGYIEVNIGGVGGGSHLTVYETGKGRCVGKQPLAGIASRGKPAKRETNARSKTELLLSTKPPIVPLAGDDRESVFDDWYSEYPVKKNKPAAKRAWKKNKLDSLADTLLTDVRNRLEKDQQWQNKKYIPHPATYLNGERWHDDITPIVQTKESLPRNDNDLWPWATKHGYPAPGQKTYNQYRAYLQTIHSNGAQQ